MDRRTLLRGAAAALAANAGGNAFAQAFPSRPVTLLVPYAAGGNADLTARLFAEAMTKSLGQTCVVDNKGGGGGSIGAMAVLGSRADGHTLLFSAPSVFSVTPHLVKVAYTPASIKPICFVSKTPLVLVVKKNSKYKTLADLVAAAKANPVPMGYSGLGTPNHLAMLNLEAVGQVRFNGIPYKGSGPMLQDMLGGQIEVAADQITTSRPFIESGDLVPIAVFGQKLALFPNVPSVSTLGAEPFDVTTYLGISAPRETPEPVVATIQKAAFAALEDQRFMAGMAKLGSTVHPGNSQEFERLMKSEDEFMRKMVASGRVKAE